MIQIRVGKQKKKEKKKIYTENKIGRYVQFLIEREDFLELVASWLSFHRGRAHAAVKAVYF